MEEGKNAERELREARNMLLRLAGGGIEFIPVNDLTYGNDKRVWPVKWLDGELHSLGYRTTPHIHPKFDSPKDFWDAFERPTFSESYIWDKNS